MSSNSTGDIPASTMNIGILGSLFSLCLSLYTVKDNQSQSFLSVKWVPSRYLKHCNIRKVTPIKGPNRIRPIPIAPNISWVVGIIQTSDTNSYCCICKSQPFHDLD